MQGDLDIVADVLQGDVEIVLLDAMGDVVEDEVAIAVVAGDFEGRLVVAGAAPAGELLVFEHLVRIEGGDVAAGRGGGEVVGAPERGSPVEMAEGTVGVDAHRVGAMAGS